MSPLTADDDDDASADVAAVIAAFAGGARGTRETTPEGLDVSVLPEYTPSPPHHYVRTPARVHETAFVAPSAQLIGACVVDEGANVRKLKYKRPLCLELYIESAEAMDNFP